jgi:hypothetical protein
MKSSTKDKIKGGFEEAKGKVKEKAGKATGNPDLRDSHQLVNQFLSHWHAGSHIDRRAALSLVLRA